MSTAAKNPEITPIPVQLSEPELTECDLWQPTGACLSGTGSNKVSEIIDTLGVAETIKHCYLPELLVWAPYLDRIRPQLPSGFGTRINMRSNWWSAISILISPEGFKS